MTDADLERLLALDAAPGPALAIDAAHAEAMIAAALDGAGFAGPGGGGAGAGGGGGGGGGAAGSVAGAKIALGVAALVAAVAIVLLLARRGRGGEEAAVAPPPDAALPDATSGGGSGLAVAPPDPVDAGAPELELAPEIELAPESARRVSPERPATPPPSAADWLGEANAKRAAKQWREADALYAKVVERAPKGLAAQSALISSATIRLEHLGDPKGAAQRFRRVLAMAPGGALAEDARWGLVEVARALADRAAERAALDDFLAHHAGSPLAAQAAKRREELR